jgi:hypothetical protein
MVSSQAVLVLAVVDGYLDGNRGIDEPDEGRRNAYVVRRAAVSSAGKPDFRLVRVRDCDGKEFY